jgi:hypothetical protein
VTSPLACLALSCRPWQRTGPDAAFARQHEAQALFAECDRLIDALHAHCVDRAGFQRLIDGWGQTWHTDRPAGGKLLHRATDRAVPGLSSTSPLQTRYVPVGKMYFEGMKRLVDADVSLPGLRTGRADAIALEAYPGLLAGEILGRRSYKSETDATPERLIARLDLIDALEQGRTRLGLRLKLTPGAARPSGRRPERRPPGRGAVPDAGGLGAGPTSGRSHTLGPVARRWTRSKGGYSRHE